MKLPFRTLTLSLSGLLFFPTFGFAQNQAAPFEPIQAFPLMPRITGLGMLGDDEVVWGDMMLPLAGNSNSVWYADVQSKTAFDTDWLGSAGTGVRQVANPNSIWGAYVFVDRTVSPDSNIFWFISPGIEELGTWIDFRANGYFPTNTKKQYGQTDWADNFGVYDYVSFQGHEQYDILMNQEEEVGWGGDAEIGARIPGLGGTRAYIGGYHFNFDNASDINGVAGRVELPMNRYLGLTVRDSYDNEQHNTILVGLKLTLGGVNAHPNNPHQAIQERILDPIERNLATLGQGAGEPIQDILTPVNQPSPAPMLERDNIWFFSPTGTDTFSGSIEDCTAENVCASTDFSQSTIDGINSLKASSPEINDYLSTSPSFYLAPGNYSSLDGNDPLKLNNDWIWGRSADFTQEQQSAILTGAMVFNGDNNLLNNIILRSDGTQDIGIQLNPNSFLNMQASQIGTNLAASSYHTAIQVNSANLLVTDFMGVPSEIIAYGNDGQAVTGLIATPGSLIILNNSELTSTAIWEGDQDAGASNSATGIEINGSTLAILNSTVQATAQVTGVNNGYNLASAIGANGVGENLSFQNNLIFISGSETRINADATISEDNIGGVNAAVGIGENLVNTSGDTALFSGNIININSGSQINSTTEIMGNNLNFNPDPDNPNLSIIGNNMATGIGNNAVDADNAITQNNSFTIDAANVTSLASVELNNSQLGEPEALNLATGIGGNASTASDEDSTTNASFVENSLEVLNLSQIEGNATIGINNFSFNFAAGIGGNSFRSRADFTGNTTIAINKSQVKGSAIIAVDNSGKNFATGLGGNSANGSVSFNTNASISVNNGSLIEGLAEIEGDNFQQNFATGLGSNIEGGGPLGNASFSDNLNINIFDSTVNGTARVSGNSNQNLAVGIGGNGRNGSTSITRFTDNLINISSSFINGLAEVGGDSFINLATGIGANDIAGGDNSFENNSITLNNAIVSGSAMVTGENFINNFATGIGNTDFIDNTQIIITGGSITATAEAGNNSANNQAIGVYFQGGSTGTATINGTDITANGLAGGSNTVFGLSSDVLAVDMNGGSITTDPNTSFCATGNVNIDDVMVVDCIR